MHGRGFRSKLFMNMQLAIWLHCCGPSAGPLGTTNLNLEHPIRTLSGPSSPQVLAEVLGHELEVEVACRKLPQRNSTTI